MVFILLQYVSGKVGGEAFAQFLHRVVEKIVHKWPVTVFGFGGRRGFLFSAATQQQGKREQRQK